jgi:hypothetical protein
MPFSSPLPATLGVVTVVHASPFHVSTRGVRTFSFVAEYPTAVQIEILEQAILDSRSEAANALGLGTTDHATPFHSSTSVRDPVLPDRTLPKYLPTAKHVFEAGHATSTRLAPLELGGLGLAVINHGAGSDAPALSPITTALVNETHKAARITRPARVRSKLSPDQWCTAL